MKLIRTPAEIQALFNAIAHPVFNDAEMLMVMFKTTEEFVKTVVPAPLKPAKVPAASLVIANWKDSNCVGPFESAALYVNAEYEGVEGSYCLAMPMNSDTAIIYGRETMGEPKKQANTKIFHEGGKIIGTVHRQGFELVRLALTPKAEMDPSALFALVNYHFKYTFAADGTGLDYDPKLVQVLFKNDLSEAKACDVEMALSNTRNDVFGEIPVVEILAGIYSPSVTMNGESKYVATADKEAFLPYAFGKVDPYDNFAR